MDTKSAPKLLQRLCKDMRHKFLAVWVDENIHENDDQNSVSNFPEVSYIVHTSTDMGECLFFIAAIKAENTFLICFRWIL